MSKGTETRKRILETAAPLFNRKGFAGCSLHDIVTAAGIEKGGLYGHFSTKEAVAVAAFEHAWKETCQSRTAGMHEVTGAIGKLRLHVHNAILKPTFPGGCPLFNTVIDSDDGNLALRREARNALTAWRIFLEGIVQQGKERGEIRSEISAAEVVSVMIAMLEGAMALDRFDREGSYLERARTHVDAYLESLSPAGCFTH